MIGVIIALVAAFAVVAVIAWDEVRGWIESHRIDDGMVELLRTRLDSGDYRLEANVLNRHGAAVHNKSWRTKSLDGELQSRFGARDRIVITQ